MYEQDSLSALDAITEAQRIAFAPMLFQTALCLRNAGVLSYLDRQGKHGATLADITEHSHINEYAASVLLDMGLSGRIITCKEGIYYLAKIGHYLLHDTMTRVNMDFTQDVCYQGLFFL
ncbi:SAM-dependent methyltransferase, partial [Escherichia coli]